MNTSPQSMVFVASPREGSQGPSAVRSDSIRIALVTALPCCCVAISPAGRFRTGKVAPERER
eukprot:341411-Chlamydomonas_euryale.AAC.3